MAARRGQLHRSRAGRRCGAGAGSKPTVLVAAAAGLPPSIRPPICGEMAAPAKQLHGSLLHHDICGYWHVQHMVIGLCHVSLSPRAARQAAILEYLNGELELHLLITPA